MPLTTSAMWDLPRVGAPSADASGDVVVVPVTTVTLDDTTTTLWRLLPDGPPVALTHGASAGAPVVSPGGSKVAFVRRVDGRGQLHVLPLDGGEARQVTDLPLGIVGSARWVDEDTVLVVTRLLDDEQIEELRQTFGARW